MSDEPIITAAIRAGRLSAPHFSRSVENAAVDAPPENGRVAARGASSAGIPNAASTGASRRSKALEAPLFSNMASTHMSAVRTGISLTVVRIPSSAPRTKSAKEQRPQSIKKAQNRSSVGMMIDAAFTFLPSRLCANGRLTERARAKRSYRPPSTATRAQARHTEHSFPPHGEA